MLNIQRTPDSILIGSDYSPVLPSRAKKISGRWDPSQKVWIFPLAAEPQVEALYRDVYGEWDTPTETVSLLCRVEQKNSVGKDSICLSGRVIATANGRDSGARTAPGVIVIKGGFSSGGSVKNWTTDVENGTVFRLLDVPRPKADYLISNPEWCSEIEIETVHPIVTDINIEALNKERNDLLKRIQEIEDILKCNKEKTGN